MAKIMVSLLPETATKVREEVQQLYHGKVGGLSIFFEMVLREYFNHKFPASWAPTDDKPNKKKAEKK